MAECKMQPASGREYCERDPLRHLPLAIAYVPWQRWNQICPLEKALQIGTIFPELDQPFLGKRGGYR